MRSRTRNASTHTHTRARRHVTSGCFSCRNKSLMQRRVATLAKKAQRSKDYTDAMQEALANCRAQCGSHVRACLLILCGWRGVDDGTLKCL